MDDKKTTARNNEVLARDCTRGNIQQYLAYYRKEKTQKVLEATGQHTELERAY